MSDTRTVAPERLHVPTAREMAELDDVALAALQADIQGVLASINYKIERARQEDRDHSGLNRARNFHDRALKAITNIQNARHGRPFEFVTAKPVTSWETGYLAIKAMNRLLGLAQAEHEALARWMTAGGRRDGAEWMAVTSAFDDVKRALAALPDVDDDDYQPVQGGWCSCSHRSELHSRHGCTGFAGQRACPCDAYSEKARR